MRALVLGIDGYLGWALSCTLAQHGHPVFGIDNGLRRILVNREKSISALPIPSLKVRIDALNDTYVEDVEFLTTDLSCDYDTLRKVIIDFQPDTIFHLGQMPSAPFSMRDRESCLFTHQNNLLSTLNLLWAVRDLEPTPHIVKIGTMGEYGQPNVPIPEGNTEINIGGRTDTLPFPRSAGSWYHQTKVHDTHNIRMACSQWGLSCTDVMQGIVYGSRVSAMVNNPLLATRLDFDECFGTIINRFVVQSVCKHPLTVYGQGTQVRSILPLQDSINCLMLLAENRADPGEYREVNQFHEYRSLNEMAQIVTTACEELTSIKNDIEHISNPRIEKEKHFYQPTSTILPNLGYVNSECMEKVSRCMIIDAFEQRTILKNFSHHFTPTVSWSGDIHTATQIHRN